MRQFASAGFRLWNLSAEAKVIYTFFCALALLALGSSLALYEDLVGPTLRLGPTERVRQYYGEAAPPSAIPSTADKPAPSPPSDAGPGPQIALPGEAEAESAAAGPLTVSMPYRKLLEVTHFHLFTVPVFLLVLTHLFMLTAASRRQKLLWIVLGWSAGTLHIAAPWLIRYGGPRLALAFPLSGILLLVSGLVLTVYPAVVMWRRPSVRHKARAKARAQAAAAAAETAGRDDGDDDDEATE